MPFFTRIENPYCCFSAFSTPAHRMRLDHFFSLLLQRALLAEQLLQATANQSGFLEPLCDVIRGVRAVGIPEETKVDKGLDSNWLGKERALSNNPF